jgi:hypothetical protein
VRASCPIVISQIADKYRLSGVSYGAEGERKLYQRLDQKIEHANPSMGLPTGGVPVLEDLVNPQLPLPTSRVVPRTPPQRSQIWAQSPLATSQSMQRSVQPMMISTSGGASRTTHSSLARNSITTESANMRISWITNAPPNAYTPLARNTLPQSTMLGNTNFNRGVQANTAMPRHSKLHKDPRHLNSQGSISDHSSAERSNYTIWSLRLPQTNLFQVLST